MEYLARVQGADWETTLLGKSSKKKKKKNPFINRDSTSYPCVTMTKKHTQQSDFPRTGCVVIQAFWFTLHFIRNVRWPRFPEDTGPVQNLYKQHVIPFRFFKDSHCTRGQGCRTGWEKGDWVYGALMWGGPSKILEWIAVDLLSLLCVVHINSLSWFQKPG